jgi:hypothetical protein
MMRRGLFKSTIPTSHRGADEHNENHQVSRPRFEPDTSNDKSKALKPATVYDSLFLLFLPLSHVNIYL